MSQLSTRFDAGRLVSAVAMISSICGCARTDRVIGVQLDSQTPDGSGAGTAGASVGVGVTKESEVILSSSGLTSVALGGYLNGESYQQDGIVSFQRYQYAAFWNNERHVVLARRALPAGAWASIEFTDYANTQSIAADIISIGVCPGDGTIHLSFDNLALNNTTVGELHYRKSVVGLATDTSAAAWSSASFSSVTSALVTGTSISKLVYPRIVAEPGGKLLFEATISGATNGAINGGSDEYLWEYASDTHAWAQLGRFIAGIGDTVTAYAHRLSYTPNSTRLHLSWCWREDTADVSTNHDLLYIYSDDNGRTWQNSGGVTVATTGTSALTRASVGIQAWAIGQNRGLLNQEHMAIDAAGEVHVLLSHMPDSASDDPSFPSARTKSEFFHYLRDTNGNWTRSALNVPVVANFRGKLALSSSGNAYAVLPDLRIAAASAAAGYTDWVLINTVDSGRFFSDPLIDSARLLSEDQLSIFYPQKSSGKLWVLDYALR